MYRKILSILAKVESGQQQLVEDDAYAYGAQLLSEAREELNRADAKAQILLGIVGLGTGAITGGLIAGSWSPFSLSNAVEWLWWTGAAAALMALICLAGAVYPRISRKRVGKPASIAYYGDILQFDSVAEAREAIIGTRTFDLARVCDQLIQVSSIVNRKYRLIRTAFWLALAAIIATISAFLLNLAFH
ncbi:Pycsar system effector family protein [Nonomuraea sp. NPDC052129]|uniref:Pycsar system effector family protein n=1 Tax=Nonomuraea sp. NPDC052129 TaxID=3154651 RepID=UPI003431E9A3